MREVPRKLLRDWLLAEDESHEVRAEKALDALFSALPAESPSRAFVDRVMAAVGESRRPALVTWIWRLGVAACLVLAAASLIVLPSLVLALPLAVGSLISALADGLVAAAGWIGHGLRVWDAFAGLGHKTALVMATPQAMLLLLLTGALGATAFRLLFGLTMQDRRSLHADSV